MPRGEGVERALAGVEEGRDPALLPQGVHPGPAPGEQLVRVGLMPDVEDQVVLGRVEDPVEGDDELHRAQRGAEVAAHPSADGDDLRCAARHTARGAIPRAGCARPGATGRAREQRSRRRSTL